MAFPIPRELKAAAEVALNGLLRQALALPNSTRPPSRVCWKKCASPEFRLDQSGLEIVLRRNLEKGAERFFEDPRNLARLSKFRENLVAARSLPFPLVLWSGTESLLRSAAKFYPQVRDAAVDGAVSRIGRPALLLRGVQNRDRRGSVSLRLHRPQRIVGREQRFHLLAPSRRTIHVALHLVAAQHANQIQLGARLHSLRHHA